MLITQTPFRISFSGGSSDLQDYLNSRHYGCVISCAIDKYMYIVIKNNFENSYILKYSLTEHVKSIDEIKHELIRNSLKRNYLSNIDFASFSDVPHGTGLATSSAFTVGCLNAFKTFKNEKFSQLDLAIEAQNIEIKDCCGNLGYQDQPGCAIPGAKFIEFADTDTGVQTKIQHLDLDFQDHSLVLMYTGKQHNTNKELSIKKDFCEIDDLVQLTLDLKNSKISLIDCIKENWKIKSRSNSDFDDLYNYAIENGATCGKLLGSGNGGFFCFLVRNPKEFISRIKYKCFKVNLDNGGSQCILNTSVN